MEFNEDSEDPFLANEEDEEEYHEKFPDSKELVVYLVDCAEPMFLHIPPGEAVVLEEDKDELAQEKGDEEQADDKTYFDAVLKCIEGDLKSRIISRDYDEVGMVLFNTREKKNKTHSEGVYVVQDLKPVSAGFIREVRELPVVFASKIGSRSASQPWTERDSPLYNALWASQGLFALMGPSGKTQEKRILLFTNTDEPFGDVQQKGLKADLQRTCIQRSKDAESMGISLELFPLSPPGEEFNVNIFYKDIINSGDDADPSNFMTNIRGRFKDLVSQMLKRSLRKRMVRRFFLSIGGNQRKEGSGAEAQEEGSGGGGGMQICLRGYALNRPEKIRPSLFVRAVDNAEVEVETEYIDQDTGAVVDPKSTTKGQFLGSGAKTRWVEFEEGVLQSLRPIPLTSLDILGLKPLSAMLDYHNLGPPTFLYPEEESMPGSIPAFIALHKAMINQEKFALVVSSDAGMPRLAALLPQEEELDELGDQLRPPGWNIIPLPFREDITNNEDLLPVESKERQGGGGTGAIQSQAEHSDWNEPTEEERISLASIMMRRMKLKDFSVMDIQNPVLQSHYAALETVALNWEDKAKPEDTTLPDAKSMKRPAVVKSVSAFKDAVYGPEFEEVMRAREIEAAEEIGATERKRKMLAEAAAGRCQEIDWRGLAEQGKLEKLTVEDLRSYLRANNLQISGRKKELAERIVDHLRLVDNRNA